MSKSIIRKYFSCNREAGIFESIRKIRRNFHGLFSEIVGEFSILYENEKINEYQNSLLKFLIDFVTKNNTENKN